MDIWRVATLMLKRYGDAALAQSAKRSENLATDGDAVGAAIWHRVIDAIGQLTKYDPSGAGALTSAPVREKDLGLPAARSAIERKGDGLQITRRADDYIFLRAALINR
jgi:hypothetical protein